jgi:tRNA A37 threonylcarbamoyladenosine dehydratase
MENAPHRFGGIARLYGQDALTSFASARVAIIGIGGIGSWAVEALARSAIGSLTLVDFDDLCVTNTNRQVHAHDGNFGRSKVRAMTERIHAINPDIRVDPVEEFFSERNAAELLASGFDAVVDAIDSVRPKCLLLATCRAEGIPVITCGAAGGRRDPSLVRTADLARTHGDALLMQVRRDLRSEYGFPKGDPKPKRFRIPAIFSPEPPHYPQCDGSASPKRPDGIPPGIRCDAGYGTVTHLTATFGFFAASWVLELLA